MIAGLLSIVLGIVQLILGLRIVLVFFNVSTAGAPAIVSTVYNWSVPLVQPFTAFVPTVALGGYTLDLPAVVAVLVYGVIGGILIRMLRSRK